MAALLLVLALDRPAPAAGLHGGVPVRGVEGLGEPAFQTAAEGWTALVEGGLVRVFVGRDEAAAAAWAERMAGLLGRRWPLAELPGGPGDRAWGDGEEVIVALDGNVGVAVQAEAGASGWAERLLAAVVDPPSPWPEPPRLEPADGGLWRLVAPPGAEHLAWIGGALAPGATEPVFVEPPRRAVAWDALGRAATAEYGPGRTGAVGASSSSSTER